MSDKPTISILEAKALERARLLEQAAALDREMTEIAQIAELAAKFNLVLMAADPRPSPDGPAPETLSDLIRLYKTSADSRYKKLSHASRGHYDSLLGLIEGDYGKEQLAQLTAEHFVTWHEKWSEGGKKSIAHAKIGMVRGVVGFGTEVLHDGECAKLFGIICKLKFKAPKGRNEKLTAAQATAIRSMAHTMKRPSIALAQAFQFDGGLLQKDTIGEWVPLDEEGVSEITADSFKWVRGIRWNEIDASLMLRHSSTWLGNIEFDLRKAPMVLEELKRQFGFSIERGSRDQLPATGPIVRSEFNELPWTAPEFRRWWRQVADACGIPKGIRNSDSRARAKGVQDASEDETEGRLAL